jgi:hypothetical protein
MNWYKPRKHFQLTLVELANSESTVNTQKRNLCVAQINSRISKIWGGDCQPANYLTDLKNETEDVTACLI